MKLLPYRKSVAQLYSVEFYCHRGQRMPSPVKRLLHVLIEQNGGGVSFYGSDISDPVYELRMGRVVLQFDGIWIYGVEEGKPSKSSYPSYYQVLAVIPEPNEFSQEN